MVNLLLTFVVGALVVLVRRWFALSYWPFGVGLLAGMILPELDDFVYIYFLRPYDLTSQRARMMFSHRQWRGALGVLARTSVERERLIFHTALFQIIFLVFGFLVITSTGSLFGRGLVISFLLHLLYSEARELKRTGSLQRWFKDLPLALTYEQFLVYWFLNLAALILLAFLF